MRTITYEKSFCSRRIVASSIASTTCGILLTAFLLSLINFCLITLVYQYSSLVFSPFLRLMPIEPLFLASSVFVKKPERNVTLGQIMVLYSLVYRLTEAEQTLSDRLNRATARLTLRWFF
jgi:hypothetical protein